MRNLVDARDEGEEDEDIDYDEEDGELIEGEFQEGLPV
jgi:hypothetical protein